MDINITRLVTNGDTWDYSGSVATHGANAGPNTWRSAMAGAANGDAFLIKPEDFEAFRDHMQGFGAWDEEEIAGRSDQECNALFLQLVTGDMRECGLEDCEIEDFDWEEYEERCQAGEISSRIQPGGDGQIYYYLGD